MIITPQNSIFKVKPAYEVIRDVRLQIRRLLRAFPIEIIDSAEIVGSELLENAVKYGRSLPDFPEVVFSIDSSETHISMTVSNGTFEDEHIQKFLSLTNKIIQLQKSKERQSLYIDRLKEILENPNDPHSRLGLCRIMYETNYMLEYKFEKGILHVSATSEIW
jgi:hypothetical protein